MSRTEAPLFDRVLITNDDGIEAEGIEAMRRIAEAVAREVWVVAPMTDQSGTSHSLSLHVPLRVYPRGERMFAISGTPNDCVIMAIRHLMKEGAPDLVLSGVNRGANLGDDIAYSGTVSGAMTGMLSGLRAAAFSQTFRDPERIWWETGIEHGPKVLRRMMQAGWPADVCLNVNLPDCAPGEVSGVAATRQGRGPVIAIDVEARTDTRHKDYYWLAFKRGQREQLDDSDIAAMKRRQVSVTPIGFDRTHEPARQRLAEALKA